MDFSWAEQQLVQKQNVFEFARQTLNDNLIERDLSGEFSRQLWQKCADFGIQGYAVAETYGGQGQDILSTLLMMEGFGEGCRDNGLILAINAQMWTVQLSIEQFGSEALKQRVLHGLCNGKLIGAQAITEPEAGSDIYSLAMQAQKTTDGYVLNGTKSWVTLGPVADLFLVFATVDSGLGKWGITGFVVSRDTPGLSVGATRDKMGLRTVPFSDLILEECLIPIENRLGPEGAGLSLFNASLEWERSCMFASQLGLMARQLEQSIAYARQRKQFGQAIGKFQSVANRIVDMQLRLETGRLLLYKVAWLKKQGEPATMEAAMAKLYLTQSLVDSSLDAIAIHGAKGYATEFEVERNLRDAVGATIFGGTSDVQRTIVARMLGL